MTAVPMLKSIAGHTGLADCKRYLESGKRGRENPDRVLAQDLIGFAPREETDWAQAMDAFRRQMGTDFDWGEKKCVTYQHFIISPDPADGISLESLRDLATAWVEKEFGSEGRLGTYQVAIVYHDDNANGIPHAHVIVNNPNFGSEGYRRLQINNRQNKKILPDDLQALAEERGLRHFDNAGETRADDGEGPQREDRRPSRQADHRTKTERALEEQGRWSWVGELRDAVAVASNTAGDFDDFIAILAANGIETEVRPDGDILYRHPSAPDSRKKLGSRMGTAYVRSGIEASMERSRFRLLLERAGGTGESVRDMRSIREVTGLGLERVAQVVNAVNFLDCRDVEDMAMKAAREKRLSAAAANPSEKARHAELAARLEDAAEHAAQLGIDAPPRKPQKRAMPATSVTGTGEGLSLKDKVMGGYRVTKAEYASLTEGQKKILLENQWKRKHPEAGKHRQEEPGGRRSSSSHGQTQSGGRARGGDAR